MNFKLWFIPTFGMTLGLIVGWFYAVFVACFVASIGRIMWSVYKGYFGMVSGQKLACTGATKELSGTQLCGTHAITWLGSKLQPSTTQLLGFRRNCVALAHLQTFNFE